MNLNLDQLEERLQALIEVHLINYLPIKKEEGLLAQQLAATIQDNLNDDGDKKIAPNIYTLAARPTLVAEWQDNPDLIRNFKHVIETIATEAELEFTAPLAFSLAPDPTLGPDEIKILASQRIDKIIETRGMEAQESGDEIDSPSRQIPDDAFLIIHGSKIFPLKKSVLNIGRRMENDLRIDDPRISRKHAQLRAVNGRFVIFDLNSSGGTYVNNQRSHQSVLYPGDVISLAGVPLIYGQDNLSHQVDIGETAPFDVFSSAKGQDAVLRNTADLNNKKKI